MKSVQLLITLLLLIAFALTFFVTGSVEAAPLSDWTDTEEFKQIVENVESWRSTAQIVLNEKERHPLLTVDLILAVIAQESYGNQYALSYKGARGLMQVMCFGWMNVECSALYNPIYNFEWGIWYLDGGMKFCQTFHTRVKSCALQIYYCGSTGCEGYYVRRVLDFWLPYFAFDKYPKSFYTGIRNLYLTP